MAFEPKNAELLGETYRNSDELIRLKHLDRSLSITIERAQDQLARVRERKAQLRSRNEEIDWQLRRDSLKTVSLTEWRNRVRAYQPEIAA